MCAQTWIHAQERFGELTMTDDDNKDHKRGILKPSGSTTGTTKHITYDEENVLKTHHPPNKDYGFMIIDESKTPYERHGEDVEANLSDPVDAKLLAEKLAVLANGGAITATCTIYPECNNCDETCDGFDYSRPMTSRRAKESALSRASVAGQVSPHYGPAARGAPPPIQLSPKTDTVEKQTEFEKHRKKHYDEVQVSPFLY